VSEAKKLPRLEFSALAPANTHNAKKPPEQVAFIIKFV
jgi:hypothetical protein